jgi:Domain of unknown function (DUF4424)
MRVLRSASVLLSIALATVGSLRADDGAASIAAGGVILMKRETRIVMAKEVLSISPWRVLVDYDFRNNSDEDITTEVAFPIPAYTLDADSFATPQLRGFDDFKLWIAGKPVQFRTETRAFVGKRDVTALLLSMKVDPGSMGHFNWPTNGEETFRDIDRLTQSQRKRLRGAGAIGDVNNNQPQWRIEKKYHWTQTFPAHRVVHIRHQYTPVLGNSNTIGNPADYRGKGAIPEYAESCPAPALRETLSTVWAKPQSDYGSPLWISYVSFILTTANTWKTPIEDFTLIVERPHDPKEKTYVSFCWDGPVTQVDADHFSAHITDLVPKKELMIGYIHDNVK